MPIKSGVHEKGTFSLQDVIDAMKKQTGFHEAGAIATFVGVVRGSTEEGEKVQRLTLEAYEDKANEVLTDICSDLRNRPGVVDVQIYHLLGEFDVGEDLVYVLVAGSHRKDVFPVLEEAVERYKKEAPIFKKEQIIMKKGEQKTRWTNEKEGK